MNRMVLSIVLLFVSICVLHAAEIELPDGFTVVENSTTYKKVLTPYATYPVLMEEYEQTVLFECPWGSEPGQLGAYDIDSKEHYEPGRMAINSRNEIYILDTPNLRIQKFNYQGKHIKSIPIRPLSMHPRKNQKLNMAQQLSEYYHGQDIAIDSKDNLYYYGTKENKGIVWKFNSNDVLVSSMSASYATGLTVDNSDDVWVAGKKLTKGPAIPEEFKNRIFSFKKDDYYYTQKEGQNKEIRIEISKEPGRKPECTLIVFPVKKLSDKEKIFLDISRPDDFGFLKDGTIMIRCNHGYSGPFDPIAMKYTATGSLISIGFKALGTINKANGDFVSLRNLYSRTPVQVILNHARKN